MRFNGNVLTAAAHFKGTMLPCIVDSGNPNNLDDYTQGDGIAVGMLYMDTDNGDLYKCTAENDSVYTWELVCGVKAVNGTAPNENGNVEIPIGLTKTVLWENASLRSHFATQTLAVDMTGYDEIEVEFSVWGASLGTSGDTRHKVAIPLKKSSIYSGYVSGEAIYIIASNAANESVTSITKYSRYFEPVSQNELFFGQTVNLGGGKANGYMIPTSIYGIKGVQ